MTKRPCPPTYRKSTTPERLLVVLDEGEDVETGEFGASVEECEFDGEGRAFDFAAEILDEFGGCGGGASGGEKVVANDNAFARFDGVFVNFESVGSVFQSVGDSGGFAGKLFWFAYWNESRAETVSQCRREDEAACFDARNNIDRMIPEVIAEPVDQRVKALLVFQKRGEIVEKNSRLRIVLHFADQFFQVIHSNAPYLKKTSLQIKQQAKAGSAGGFATTVPLLIVRDAEFFCEFRLDLGGLFGKVLNHGATRAAFDDRAKAREIFRQADGVHFHASVAKIAHEARETQPFGFVLSEITEPDTLHDSGHEVAASDLSGSH
jgi:hypothetical protein